MTILRNKEIDEKIFACMLDISYLGKCPCFGNILRFRRRSLLSVRVDPVKFLKYTSNLNLRYSDN